MTDNTPMPRLDADLVLRLRWLSNAHDRLEQGGGASEELAEAADEIERLRAHRDGMYQDRIEQAAEIERLRVLVGHLETALRAIQKAPICGDPQHRHTGTCGPYRSAGMTLMRDIARRALEGLTLLCQRERAAAADRIHEIEELELEVHLRDGRIEALELDRDKHAAAAEIRDERWKVVTGERDAEIERLRTFEVAVQEWVARITSPSHLWDSNEEDYVIQLVKNRKGVTP